MTRENSKIEFVGYKVTGSHNGSFEKFSGEINYVGAPEKGRVRIHRVAPLLRASFRPHLTTTPLHFANP